MAYGRKRRRTYRRPYRRSRRRFTGVRRSRFSSVRSGALARVRALGLRSGASQSVIARAMSAARAAMNAPGERQLVDIEDLSRNPNRYGQAAFMNWLSRGISGLGPGFGSLGGTDYPALTY